jgi:hypothetical protein
MPVVGEAIYEISARDEKLVGALRRAEGQARSSGAVIENAVDGKGATAGMNQSAAAVGRFGGMMDKAKAKTSGFGSAFGGLASGVMMGVGMGAFMGVSAAAGALVDGVGSAITAASDLNETVSKVGVVFGPAADRVKAFGADSATAMGMSQNAALSAAGTFGNLMVAMGASSDAAADTSIGMVKLAGDLASFNNVSPEEALEALRSGLVGEAEPLRRFGVQLSAARIEQEALSQGLWDGQGALSSAAKAQATYSLIMKDTATAQGDFARTSTGLANQQRIASARQEDAMAKLGQTLLPIANAILPALSNAMAGVMEWITGIITSIGEWADENRGLVDMLGALAGLVGTVLAGAFQTLGNVLGWAFGVIGDVVGALTGIVKPVVEFLIGALKAVMDVAAQIPGPFQDAAISIRDSLAQMQEDAKSWGEETTTTVESHGEAISGKMAQSGEEGAAGFAAGLEDGAGAAEEAAKALTKPVGVQVQKTKAEIAKEGAQTAAGYAGSLRGGYDETLEAAKALRKAVKDPISTTKRIAELEGILTSKSLRKGLRSDDPMVRADAQALQKMAGAELAQLRGLAKQYGQAAGANYAAGLSTQLNKVERAAEALGEAVSGRLRVHSPAKFGPLSRGGGPEGFGERFGRLYGQGMERGFEAARLDRFLPTLDRFTVTGSALTRQEATLRVVIEDKDGGLGRAGMTEAGLADHVQRALDATGLFYSLSHAASMRGG